MTTDPLTEHILDETAMAERFANIAGLEATVRHVAKSLGAATDIRPLDSGDGDGEIRLPAPSTVLSRVLDTWSAPHPDELDAPTEKDE